MVCFGHWRMGLVRVFLLAILVGDMARGSPRPYSKSKGSHGLNLGRDWGLGLGQATWDIRDFQNSNMDTTVQHILSRDNSPSVRLLLHDQLFLRHLDLFLARPSKKHFHQLKNRAKTLHRRRTDEVSTRFFLRD
eukprot:TRINITY_DN10348_c0_g1_i1.p1 TRINITY_DN10348_c0_g1~~TRINITY_DN10348_c0_g1_i1.p1  ORF type:complete len:134 (-),score=33.66 TRINITY_DN10348_c0_g1_i1:133-534(-)